MVSCCRSYTVCRATPQAQRGAVLAASLLLLLILTVLALGASRATRTQQEFASDTRARDLAFQSTEAGLRAGERLIDGLAHVPLSCTSHPCEIYERGVVARFGGLDSADWWENHVWAYAPETIAATGPNATSAPSRLPNVGSRYYVEELEQVYDSLTVSPAGPSPSRSYFRVTAASSDVDPVVILQSTVARRFE